MTRAKGRKLERDRKLGVVGVELRCLRVVGAKKSASSQQCVWRLRARTTTRLRTRPDAKVSTMTTINSYYLLYDALVVEPHRLQLLLRRLSVVEFLLLLDLLGEPQLEVLLHGLVQVA